MSALRTVGAFVRRDWAVARSYRLPFVLEFVSLLVTLGIFYFIGRLVGPGAARSHNLSHGYFAYVAIGIGLLAIAQTGLISFSQRLREEQTTGTLEAMLSTPTSPSLVILASAAYDVLRATVVGGVALVLAVGVFGLRLSGGPLAGFGVLLALIGVLGFFVALGVAIAAFVIVFKQGLAAASLLALALSLLGGVYFPLSVMPSAVRALGNALPFTWALEALRAGLLRGQFDGAKLAELIGAAIVIVPLALVLFAAALRRTRRTGTLAHY